MTAFLFYLLKANMVLMILYGFYWLFLRKDTFYGYHRWYLLFALAAAFTVPLVELPGWTNRSESAVELSYMPDMEVVYQLIFAQLQQENEVVEPLADTVVEKTVSPNEIGRAHV